MSLLKKLLILLFTTGAFACGIDDPVDQTKLDKEKIQNYLVNNSLIATEHSSGIFYNISVPGSGGNPASSSDVTVRYKGYFLDDSVFDQSGTDPVTFPLSNLIEGWQICIPLLQKGGKGTFWIPSRLGYADEPPLGSGIPPNAVLIFDIELVDFQ